MYSSSSTLFKKAMSFLGFVIMYPFAVIVPTWLRATTVLTQCKQMGEQDYVFDLELGTNKTLGYAHAKENEKIIMLKTW